ncbi:MAG: hypothetical protein MUC96_18170 [Myxococcaceae bacterium]|jgi:lipocalin|nr:hypothetical protein [Myxococcaceae bacterium]
MRCVLIGVVCAGCASAPVRATSAPSQLDLSTLTGRWHVIASTFPMWKQRCDVTFTYGPRTDTTLTDRVAFTEGGRAQELLGVDTQHPEVRTHFTWRGNGLLSLFSSEWDVVALAPDASWVVLTFGATLATPAGADVIARSPTLEDDVLREAVSVASTDEVTRARLTGLFRVSSCPAAALPGAP